MQLIINSRRVEVTPDVRDYVEEKIGKAKHIFDNIISIRVELKREEKRDDGKPYSCEVLVSVPGKLFRVGKERGKELFEAIDLAEAALEEQIRSFKEKMIDESRRAKEFEEVNPAEMTETAAEEEDDGYDYMEYVSEIDHQPMTMEEAIKQMELLKYDFYVYTDKETGKRNTVYKKRDGRYGVVLEK
jgi:putative sigma-54 modulation protein